jgi:glutamate synthase domain-containing protein 3
MARIDAKDMHYRVLNEKIRELVNAGEDEIEIDNVCGQKFIGDGLCGKVRIDINGIPGNDLAIFMDGPKIVVRGNGQDGIGNTMNSGKVIVHGNVGDVIGYAMRGGKVFIKGDVGYRVGIHMKAYQDNVPIIVIGGTASDFLGEYMAGGVMVLLGLTCNGKEQLTGDYVGTGMHGGVIYVRGDIDDHYLGREVVKSELDAKDISTLGKLVGEYCTHFGGDFDDIMRKPFIKLTPRSLRPYGNLYTS